MSPLDPEKGWEILLCQKCGYAVEKCRLTRYFLFCPICRRQGRQVRLVDRYVVHVPENKILAPLKERK